jgi:hypothetical protein
MARSCPASQPLRIYDHHKTRPGHSPTFKVNY